MNTKIYIIAGAIIVLGAVGAFIYNNTNTPEEAGVDLAGGTTQTMEETQPAGKKMAFSELLKQGGSYQCTVDQYVGEMVSKGTVFIDKDRIRGEFATAVQGMNINTSMIVRDGFTYTWTSAMPTKGFKAKVVEVVGGDAVVDTGTSGTYSFNATQIGDYNCADWNVDESKFALPAGVTFTEIKS